MAPTAEELAARALELVRIPSPIGHEGKLADHLEAWARRVFPREQVLRRGHSLVLGALEGDARPAVGLVGHLDTVPAHPGAAAPRLEGGRLHGLGSSDMKGALAVLMALAETLDRAALPVNPLFVLYEREEGPWAESGLGPLLDTLPALRALALAVALEPTDGAVQLGCVGSLHVTARFGGKAAHSARPWQGQNAIHAAGGLLQALQQRGRREVTVGGHAFFEVLSATLAKGGRARNVVPDAFELNLNYRFAPGKTLEAAQDEVRAFVGAQAELTFTDLAPSGRVCADNPLCQKLVALSGRPAEAKQAWTDVARLSQAGVDALNYGPGETAQAHQADESAGVAALLTAYQVLAEFLRTAR